MLVPWCPEEGAWRLPRVRWVHPFSYALMVFTMGWKPFREGGPVLRGLGARRGYRGEVPRTWGSKKRDGMFWKGDSGCPVGGWKETCDMSQAWGESRRRWTQQRGLVASPRGPGAGGQGWTL